MAETIYEYSPKPDGLEGASQQELGAYAAALKAELREWDTPELYAWAGAPGASDPEAVKFVYETAPHGTSGRDVGPAQVEVDQAAVFLALGARTRLGLGQLWGGRSPFDPPEVTRYYQPDSLGRATLAAGFLAGDALEAIIKKVPGEIVDYHVAAFGSLAEGGLCLDDTKAPVRVGAYKQALLQHELARLQSQRTLFMTALQRDARAQRIDAVRELADRTGFTITGSSAEAPVNVLRTPASASWTARARRLAVAALGTGVVMAGLPMTEAFATENNAPQPISGRGDILISTAPGSTDIDLSGITAISSTGNGETTLQAPPVVLPVDGAPIIEGGDQSLPLPGVSEDERGGQELWTAPVPVADLPKLVPSGDISPLPQSSGVIAPPTGETVASEVVLPGDIGKLTGQELPAPPVEMQEPEAGQELVKSVEKMSDKDMLLKAISLAAHAHGWDNEHYKQVLMEELIKEGVPLAAAAGIAGNAKVESAGYRVNVEEFANSIGFGFFQWSFERRDALEAAAKKAGIDLTKNTKENAQFQIRYAIAESKSRTQRDGSGNEWEGLLKVADTSKSGAKKAAWYWQWNFERPKHVPPQSGRTNEAAEVFGQVNKELKRIKKAQKPSIFKLPSLPKKVESGPVAPDAIGKIVSHNSWGEAVPATIGGYKYVSQTDKRWGKLQYNPRGILGRTIGGSACGPEAAVNAVLAFEPNNKKVGPIKAPRWFQKKGARVEGGSAQWGMAAYIKAHADLNTRQINLKDMSTEEAVRRVQQGLQNGSKYVINGRDDILSTPATSVGHYWLIREIDKHDPRKAWTLDPNSVRKSRQAWTIEGMIETSRRHHGYLLEVWK